MTDYPSNTNPNLPPLRPGDPALQGGMRPGAADRLAVAPAGSSGIGMIGAVVAILVLGAVAWAIWGRGDASVTSVSPAAAVQGDAATPAAMTAPATASDPAAGTAATGTGTPDQAPMSPATGADTAAKPATGTAGSAATDPAAGSGTSGSTGGTAAPAPAPAN